VDVSLGSLVLSVANLLIGENVSKATSELNQNLASFDTAFKTQMKDLGKLNTSLEALDKQVTSLCIDLQDWVKQCGCSGGGSKSASNFNLGFAFPLLPSQGGGGGFGASGAGTDVPATGVNPAASASNVKVEVHNYGAQGAKPQPGSGGNNVTKLIGEAMARDVRSGGPLARSIQQTYGADRTPTRR
jgi:hypothetical protein